MNSSSKAWPQVSVVIVTYNSAAALAPCLAAVREAARVVIVDNASEDDTIAVAQRALPTVEVILTLRNEGYGMAANRGMARVETPYGLFVTPDAILDPDTLETLLATLERCPEAALAAPFLLDAQGRVDVAWMGPGEINHHPATPHPEGPYCTWFTNGAVWLWRMSAWAAVGGFDEAIFLYNDDVELCIRTTRAGFALVVTPEARARHLGGRSSPISRRIQLRKDWHQTWAHLYLEAKHGDAAAARRLAVRQVLRHGAKALFYLLVARPKKAVANAVKAEAAWSHLAGRPARRPR